MIEIAENRNTKHSNNTQERLETRMRSPEKKTAKKKSPSRISKRCIVATIIVLVVLTLVYKRYSQKFFTKLLNYIGEKIKSRSYESYFTFILLECIYSVVALPGAAYVDVSLGFFFKEFWPAFWLIFLSSYLSSQITFLCARRFFKNHLEKKFKDNKFFKAVKMEVDRGPWQASFIVNLVFMPMAIKNLIFPLTDMTYLQFALPSLPMVIAYDAILIQIGMKMDRIGELFEAKTYENMSLTEKLDFAISWAGIFFGVFVVYTVGKRLKKRLKALEDIDEEEEIDTDQSEDEEMLGSLKR